MNKTNKITCRCQHKSCKQAPFCSYSQRPRNTNPITIFNHFSRCRYAEREAFNILLSLSFKHPIVYISHETLAGMVGVKDIGTIVRWMNEWRELGFLGSETRLYKTSIYLVSTIFNNQEVRDLLKGLFKSLHKLAIGLLWVMGTFGTRPTVEQVFRTFTGSNQPNPTLLVKSYLSNSKSHALAELRDGRSTPGLTTSAVKNEENPEKEGDDGYETDQEYFRQPGTPGVRSKRRGAGDQLTSAFEGSLGTEMLYVDEGWDMYVDGLP